MNVKPKLPVLILLVIICASALLYFASHNINYGILKNLDYTFVDTSDQIKALTLNNAKDKYININSASVPDFDSSINYLSKTTIIGATKNNLFGYSFNNATAYKKSLSLNQILDPSAYLTLNSNGDKYFLGNKADDLKIGDKKINIPKRNLLDYPSITTDQGVKINNRIVPGSDLSSSAAYQVNDITNANIQSYNTSSNLLSDNPSFESGLWSPVKDCKDKGSGNVSLINDGTDHSSAAKVVSTIGMRSCLGKVNTVSLSKYQNYQLSFDYKTKKGSQINFFINMGNIKNSQYAGRQYFFNDYAKSSEWSTYRVTLPKQIVDTNEFDMFFFAPVLDGNNFLETNFDNVALKEYVPNNVFAIDTLTEKSIELFDDITIRNRDNNISHVSDQNILTGNVDFESGKWEPVEDCINNDMGVKFKKENSMNGNYVEVNQFNGKRNCTSQAFNVSLDASEIYQLSFDYRNLSNKKLQYFYNLHTKYSTQSNYQFFVRESAFSTKWSKYEHYFSPPAPTQIFDLLFFIGKSTDDNGVNDYDNIKLKRYAPNNAQFYYLKSKDVVSKNNNDSATFTKSLYGQNIIIKGSGNASIVESNSNNAAVLINANGSILKKISDILHRGSNGLTKVSINDERTGWLINKTQFCGKNCNQVSIQVIDSRTISIVFFVFSAALLSIIKIYGKLHEK